MCSLGCWQHPSQCYAFSCELSLHFSRLTSMHPNFLFCFFTRKKFTPCKLSQVTTCHYPPSTHSERDKLSNFFTKDIFVKTAVEAIYFSFNSTLATVTFQRLLLTPRSVHFSMERVKGLWCRIVNLIKKVCLQCFKGSVINKS